MATKKLSPELQEIWKLFADDGRETLSVLEESLLRLESEGASSQEIGALYRAMHTFKGNARVMGLSQLEALAHEAENLVGLVRDEGVAFSQDIAACLFEVLDILRPALEEVCRQYEDVSAERVAPQLGRVRALIARKRGLSEEEILAAASGQILPIAVEGEQDEGFIAIFLEMAEQDLGKLPGLLEAVSLGSQEAEKEVVRSIEGLSFACEQMNWSSLREPLQGALDALSARQFDLVRGAIATFQSRLAGLGKRSSAEELAIEMDETPLDPSIDPAFVRIFLEICEEQLGQLSDALQQHCRGVADSEERALSILLSLHHAASEMGYVHVTDILSQLQAELPGADPLRLQELEHRLFVELVAIQEAYQESFGKEGPQLILIFRQWHAERLSFTLATLQEQLETLQNDTTLASSTKALAEHWKSASHGCRFFELSSAAQLCLTWSDYFARLGQEEARWDDELNLSARTSVTTLIDALTSLQSDEEPLLQPLDQHIEQTIALLTKKATGQEREETPQLLHHLLDIQEGYQEVISPHSYQRFLEAERQGLSFYELSLDFEKNEALSTAVYAWLQSPDLIVITNVTRYTDTGSSFDFLIASSKPLSALQASLRTIDPQETIASLRQCRHPSATPVPAAVAEPIRVPEPPAKKPTESKASPKPVAPKTEPTTAPAVAKPLATEPVHEEEAAGRGDSFLRIDAAKVAKLMNLAGEIGLAAGAALYHPELQRLGLEGFSTAVDRLEALIRELQDEASSLRLVPVTGLFRRMQRMVRDLSRQTGKEIDLVLRAGETDMDKLMLDQLYDPLVHILRNAADHGLESTEDRIAAGKPAHGRITLAARHVGSEVHLTISDDGRGLQSEKILAKARAQGLCAPDATPSEQEIFQFILLPGFSTAAQVSNLSGRGVGMDVVNSVVRSLRGRIVVQSQAGKGTTFTLALPLTLAFIDGMIVRIANRLYALPVESVSEVLLVEAKQVMSIRAEQSEVLRIRDEFVPIFWLQHFYREPLQDSIAAGRVALVLRTSNGMLAMPVDELIGTQQITLKPLQGHLSQIRAGAGCGMLRSGEVAIVLDCERLHASHGE